MFSFNRWGAVPTALLLFMALLPAAPLRAADVGSAAASCTTSSIGRFPKSK
jgi:hypothetical protein